MTVGWGGGGECKGENVGEVEKKEEVKCQCMRVVTSMRESQNFVCFLLSLYAPPIGGGESLPLPHMRGTAGDRCCADALVSYAAFEYAVAEWRRAVWMVLCRGWAPLGGRSRNKAGNCLKAVSSRLMDRLQMCGSYSGDFEEDTAARLEVTNLTADYSVLKVVGRIRACGLPWLRYACLYLPAV